MIDNNLERSVEPAKKMDYTKKNKTHISWENKARSSSAEIYIPTLSRFTGYRPGSYLLNSLKKMTGTASFLGLSASEKQCQNEIIDNCLKNEFNEIIKKECDCLPWMFTGVTDDEVSSH